MEHQNKWLKAEFSPFEESIPTSTVPRLFIWAAGGTGMRVVSSLVMLCAAGIVNDVEVIPVLFDMDEHCSSLQYAVRELELYHQICQEAGCHHTSLSFFGTPIRPVMNRSKNMSSLTLDHSFIFDINREGHSHQQHIAERQPFEDSRVTVMELIESFFGKERAKTLGMESNAEILHSPSEIRLWLGDLGENEGFRHLLQIINPVYDKVIIIGSAFGNTGIAFLYELTRSLYNFMPAIPKALVLMEPYFKIVGSDHSEDLTDEIMKKRAQEFMYFFNDCNLHNKLDVTYMIGSSSIFNVENSHKVGSMQRNPNSIHEFIGALAIADFCKRTTPVKNPEILMYAVPRTSTSQICITDLLRTPTESSDMKLLTRFAMAMKYVNLNKENVDIPDTIKDFCSFFRQWISDMENVDQDSFLSFDFENPEMHRILKGRELSEDSFMYSVTHSGKPKPLFTMDNFVRGMTNIQKKDHDNRLDLLLCQMEAGADALMKFVSF